MIGLAIIKNGILYVYDSRMRQLWQRPAMGASLMGFTASSVTIRTRLQMITYNERGMQISSRSI